MSATASLSLPLPTLKTEAGILGVNIQNLEEGCATSIRG